MHSHEEDLPIRANSLLWVIKILCIISWGNAPAQGCSQGQYGLLSPLALQHEHAKPSVMVLCARQDSSCSLEQEPETHLRKKK